MSGPVTLPELFHYTAPPTGTERNPTGRGALSARRQMHRRAANAVPNETPEQRQRRVRNEFISTLQKQYDDMLKANVDQTSRLNGIANFNKMLTTVRESYTAIADPEERRETLERFDAEAEAIRAKQRGGKRKTRKAKKSRKTRKSRK